MTLSASRCSSYQKFEPPCGDEYLISVENGDAVCIKDNTCNEDDATIEPLEACNNVSGVKPDLRLRLEEWYSDKVTRLEVCLLSRKNCK